MTVVTGIGTGNLVVHDHHYATESTASNAAQTSTSGEDGSPLGGGFRRCRGCRGIQVPPPSQIRGIQVQSPSQIRDTVDIGQEASQVASQSTPRRAFQVFMENLDVDFDGNSSRTTQPGRPGRVRIRIARPGFLGTPTTIHGDPQDYAWGQEGLDTIISMLFNHVDSGPPPLDKDKIQDIPTVEISEFQVANNSSCSVCFEDFSIDEKVKHLECDHFFHGPCIIPWLKIHGTCPICRKVLDPATAAAETRELPNVEVLEKVLDKRLKRGQVEYLCKWVGLSDDNNTWKSRDYLNHEEIMNHEEAIKKFEAERKNDIWKIKDDKAGKTAAKKDDKKSRSTVRISVPSGSEANITDAKDKHLEKILDKRIKRGGKIEYLCQWLGLNETENTWESREKLDTYKDEIEKFEFKNKEVSKSNDKSNKRKATKSSDPAVKVAKKKSQNQDDSREYERGSGRPARQSTSK